MSADYRFTLQSKLESFSEGSVEARTLQPLIIKNRAPSVESQVLQQSSE